MPRRKEFDRTKVLDKAMHLFWTRGYEATSISDLCEHMGINRGSLYDTYGSKERLYIEALQHYLKLNQIELQPDQSTSGIALIKEIFDGIVETSVNDENRRGCFIANTITELSPHHQEVADLCEISRNNYEMMFHDLLSHAQQQGEIPSERDIRQLARFLVNNVYGLRIMAKTSNDENLLNDIVQIAMLALH